MDQSHRGHLEVCSRLMKAAEIDALLLSKPANLIYPTGSGRLCAYALLIAAGKRRFPSLE